MTTPLIVEPRLRRIVAASLDRARAQHADTQSSDEAQSMFERYALDPLRMLDDGLVWIYSRDYGGRVPFEAFDYQREALDDWIDRERLKAERVLAFRDTHVEKTRQMGCSWLFAYGAWWAVKFWDAQGLTLSLKSKEIDDGGEKSSWKSLHGKIRFIDKNAPAWLREHAPLRFTGGTPSYIKSATRPDSSFIIGEGQTADPGRGGTFMFAVLDEFARVEWDSLVMSAVRSACPNGKAYLSTPNGTDNEYFRLGHPRKRGIRYVRMHWSQHPRYGAGQHVAGADPETCEACRLTLLGVSTDAAGDETYARVDGAHRYYGRLVSPWYDATVEDMTDEEIAREIDINYSASLAARVYTEWSEERHVVHGPVPYDEALTLELGWDYGLDCTSVLICQDHPTEYRLIGELEVADQTPDQVAAGVRGVLREVGVPDLILSPGWTRQLYCVGDPAGEARSLNTGRSLVQDYALQGFAIRSTPRRVATTILAVKRLMRGTPKRLVVAGDQCPRFVQHAGANRWPTDASGKRRAGAPLPLDDAHNHAMRAFAYLVSAKWPPVEDTSGDAGPMGMYDDPLDDMGTDLRYEMKL